MSNHSYMPQLENKYGATRYELWKSTNNDEETYSNGWGKTGFPNNSYDTHHHEHACKPVLVDADGRERPVIAYNPGKNNMDNYVTKTEVIEQVYTPHQVARYANHSPPKVGGMKQDYGRHNDNAWNTPGDKGNANNYVTTTEIIEEVYAPHQKTRYGHHSPPKIGKDYGGGNSKGNSHVSPTHDYHRPAKVDEFVSQVQAKASEPRTAALVRNMYWRHTPNSNGHHGGAANINNHGGHQAQSHYDAYSKQEPAMITEGGWARPSRAGWGDDQVLMKPTNDIGAAIDHLKDVAVTQTFVTPIRQRRFTVPTSLIKTVETTYSTPTDHSRDLLRRYGGLVPPHVVKTTEVYSPTIDSADAARKYHGQMI